MSKSTNEYQQVQEKDNWQEELKSDPSYQQWAEQQNQLDQDYQQP